MIEKLHGPFSARLPGLITGAAGDSWRFAFNLLEPRGVKLLPPNTAKRLDALVGDSNAVPNLKAPEIPEDSALYEHGLVTIGSRYQPTAARPTDERTLNVWLHISNACNIGCFYCYIPDLQKNVGEIHERARQFVVDDTSAKAIAKRLAEHCAANQIGRLHVKFAGGEPTLAIREIDLFCEELMSLRVPTKISFGILTNGVFSPDVVIPTFVNFKFKVSISIDGTQANHDKIRFTRASRGRSGTWSTIQENILRLKEVGINPYILHTITRSNFTQIDLFAEYFSSIGCGFRLSLERSDHAVEPELQKKISGTLTHFYRSFSEFAPLEIRFDRDAKFSEWTLDKKKHIACSSCRKYFAISQRGEISSCQMRLDEPVGDLISDSIQNAIGRFSTDKRTSILHSPLSKIGDCTQCEYRHTCAGGCPQHTRNVYGEMDRPSPWCYVYGSLFPAYVQACATHLARRANKHSAHTL